MKSLTDNRLFNAVLFILTLVVTVKLIWLITASVFLPKSGVEYTEMSRTKPLYYPVKLASSSPQINAPKVSKQPNKIIGNMQGYRLVALYNASDALVVTVEKSQKTHILAKGEQLNGFKLASAGPNFAVFTKGNKEFKLLLEGGKGGTRRVGSTVSPAASSVAPMSEGIKTSDDGMGKVVSKGLLSDYSKDIDKIWKNIGITEYKTNGKLEGFKVSFVKKGSDFDKLGLKKGDIFTTVNGQALDSYNAAFSLYKEIDSIQNLTLGIKRNNQEMELEYEVE